MEAAQLARTGKLGELRFFSSDFKDSSMVSFEPLLAKRQPNLGLGWCGVASGWVFCKRSLLIAFTAASVPASETRTPMRIPPQAGRRSSI